MGCSAAGSAIGNVAGKAMEGAGKFANFAAQAGISMATSYATSVGTSFVNNWNLDADGKLAFDAESFGKSTYSAQVIAGSVGAGVTSGLTTAANMKMQKMGDNGAAVNKFYGTAVNAGITTAGKLSEYAVYSAYALAEGRSLKDAYDDMGGLTFNIGSLGMFADMMATGIARTNATGQAGKFGEIAQKLEGKGILEINIGSNGITGKFGMGGFDLAGSLYTFGKRMYDKKELESYLAANENKDNEDQEKKAAATAWTTYVYGDSTQENTVMRLVKDLDQLEFVSKEGKPDNWKAQTTSNGNGGRRIQMLDSGNDNINAIQLGHEAYRDGKTLTETEQKAETIAAVLGHAGMAGRMMGYAGNNITGDYALEGLLFNSGRTDILAAMADMNYDSSADYWRITADKTGKITKVQDDGDNSILTLVDEDGNIQSVTINDGTSLSKQITGLSKTRQSQKEINDIMVDSGLDFYKDGKKGWYAKSPEGQYKVGQNIPERQSVYRDVQVILSEDKKSVKDFRDITVFQEEIEDALGLKRHSACAIASIMMDTDSFLLKNYGIGARDSAQMIDILKKFATPAYETSGDNQGLVKNMTALSAFYAQGLGMDDYLIFDDDYTGTKPSKYYVEKAIFKDIKTGEIITNRTHFMTNTPFGYYDPDKTTNNRWWTKTKEHESVYRSATPKSSRINK